MFPDNKFLGINDCGNMPFDLNDLHVAESIKTYVLEQKERYSHSESKDKDDIYLNPENPINFIHSWSEKEDYITFFIDIYNIGKKYSVEVHKRFYELFFNNPSSLKEFLIKQDNFNNFVIIQDKITKEWFICS